MKFIDIKTQFKNGLIDIRNVITLFNSLDRRRLYEWQKKGYIKKIANNFYIFSDADMDDNFIKMTANKIYSPSYIGLESALFYYNIIPEAVFQTTSVTSRKTHKIQTEISHFSYKTINKRLFWGYGLNTATSHNFIISDPEKTILDYLYLNPHLDDINALRELRFNPKTFKTLFNPSKIRKYLTIFSNKRLLKTIKKLTKVLDVEF